MQFDFKEVNEKHAGEMTALPQCLQKVLESTLLSYRGGCSKCPRIPVSNNWLNRSRVLSSNKIHHLNMDKSDKDLLLEILKIKLSIDSVEQIKLYTDLQKLRQLISHVMYRFQKCKTFQRYGKTSTFCYTQIE